MVLCEAYELFGRALRKYFLCPPCKTIFPQAENDLALWSRNIGLVGLSGLALFCKKQKAFLAPRS